MQRQATSININAYYNRKNENIPIWINECFTFRYFTEAILVILNLVLLLKTSSNFVAYFNNSSRLIADYDGALLLNESFKFYFTLMNCLLFIASSLCLVTFLFVGSQKIKVKLIKYYTLIQSLAAFLTLLLMAKLWFSPFKLELNERSWLDDMRKYTYNSESQLNNYENMIQQRQQQQNQLILQTTPNVILSSSSVPENDLIYESNSIDSNILASNSMKRYNYVDLVDKLQYALGCCGILSPDDWRQENQLLGLLAPSCCLQPTHLEISIPLPSGDNGILLGNSTTLIGTESASVAAIANQGTAQRQRLRNFISISYCKIELSNTIGCQNLLSNRQIQFTFNLRMSLLFLLSILIILIMAALNFYAPSHLSSNNSSSQHASSSSNDRGTVLIAQQFYLTNLTSSSSNHPLNVQEGSSAPIGSLSKALPFHQADATNSNINNNENHQNLERIPPPSNHIDHSREAPLESFCMSQTNPNQQAIGRDHTNDRSTITKTNVCDTVLTIS